MGLLVVCMGRNDGASGRKQRSSNRGSTRNPKIGSPDMDAGLWYERESEEGPSSSGSFGSAPLPPAPSSWERGGSAGSGRRSSRRVRDEDDEDEDTRGWWERPEERSLQAYAAPRLEPWQEERLQLAYATGRRKAQIQDLARELDVDRSVVIAWFKEFALRPQSERDAILAARRTEEAARRAAEARSESREAAAPAAEGRAPAEAYGAAAASQKEQGASTGYIPYYLRKQQGLDKQKRISGEVRRTLESIYDRTPFPSSDVIRGLFELHRLPREAALEWFAARRAADGITSSTQKRTSRPSLRERDRDIEGAFAGGDDGPGGGSARTESSSLLAQLGPSSGRPDAGAAAGPGAPQQQQDQPAEPTVVTLSRRDMALLRSSLPSPNKHKGRQMAEKMGLKTGADTPTTQIGNVQFVAEAAPSEAEAAQRMRSSWRYRASVGAGGEAGAPASRRLRLQGRRAAEGRGGEGASASDSDE